MTKAIQLFTIILRICGGTALLLGLAFWLGYGRSFTRLHMDLGMAVVVSLWVLAALAWRGGARASIVTFAVGWGALTWAVGVSQWRLLPGSFHWIVRIVHLLLAVVSIALSRLSAHRSAAKASSRAVA